MEVLVLLTIFISSIFALAPAIQENIMGWIEKETIDARFISDDMLGKKLRSEVINKMWNLPLVIKTGSSKANPGLKNQVFNILDDMHIAESLCRDDEIEIVRV